MSSLSQHLVLSFRVVHIQDFRQDKTHLGGGVYVGVAFILVTGTKWTKLGSQNNQNGNLQI